MGIFIFSRPVRTGKTSELISWCENKKNTAGILMPDMHGNRKIMNIGNGEIADIECKHPLDTTESLISVGRFFFYINVFEKANAIIIEALNSKTNWLVIDEAGKLELQGNGFYEGIAKAIEFHHGQKGGGNLLITVRESLCHEVISLFKMTDYIIVDSLEKIPVV